MFVVTNIPSRNFFDIQLRIFYIVNFTIPRKKMQKMAALFSKKLRKSLSRHFCFFSGLQNNVTDTP